MKYMIKNFFKKLFTSTAPKSHFSRFLKKITAEQPAFMQTWQNLVNADSGTGDALGLANVEAQITRHLQELGAQVEIFSATPAVGNNIVGTFNGTGTVQIMLMIHYDTVFNVGDAAKRAFYTDATKVYGPGVADAKGGIAIILHAMKILKTLNFHEYGKLTVFFNPDEETGSLGSRELIQKLASAQDYVFSYEPPEQEEVAVGANGVANVFLQVEGIAAHAGSAPEKGRNSIVEIAHQMLQLNVLGDVSKGTTVNWTMMSGGEKTNVIPEIAQATADMRFSDRQEIARVHAQAEKIIQNQLIPNTTITLTVEERRPPFMFNPASEKLAQKAQKIYKEIDHELSFKAMRYGTDAGYAYNPDGDKPAVLEAMGIVGAHIHSPSEYAQLDSIIPRLYLTVRMIQELCGK